MPISIKRGFTTTVLVSMRERDRTRECHCEVFPCLGPSGVELPFDEALGKFMLSLRL